MVKFWTEAEEIFFWTRVVPYSPRRLESQAHNREKSWKDLADEMQQSMGGTDAPRVYTGDLLANRFRNFVQGPTNGPPLGREYAKMYRDVLNPDSGDVDDDDDDDDDTSLEDESDMAKKSEGKTPTHAQANASVVHLYDPLGWSKNTTGGASNARDLSPPRSARGLADYHSKPAGSYLPLLPQPSTSFNRPTVPQYIRRTTAASSKPPPITQPFRPTISSQPISARRPNARRGPAEPVPNSPEGISVARGGPIYHSHSALAVSATMRARMEAESSRGGEQMNQLGQTSLGPLGEHGLPAGRTPEIPAPGHATPARVSPAPAVPAASESMREPQIRQESPSGSEDGLGHDAQRGSQSVPQPQTEHRIKQETPTEDPITSHTDGAGTSNEVDPLNHSSHPDAAPAQLAGQQDNQAAPASNTATAQTNPATAASTVPMEPSANGAESEEQKPEPEIQTNSQPEQPPQPRGSPAQALHEPPMNTIRERDLFAPLRSILYPQAEALNPARATHVNNLLEAARFGGFYHGLPINELAGHQALDNAAIAEINHVLRRQRVQAMMNAVAHFPPPIAGSADAGQQGGQEAEVQGQRDALVEALVGGQSQARAQGTLAPSAGPALHRPVAHRPAIPAPVEGALGRHRPGSEDANRPGAKRGPQNEENPMESRRKRRKDGSGDHTGSVVILDD